MLVCVYICMFECWYMCIFYVYMLFNQPVDNSHQFPELTNYSLFIFPLLSCSLRVSRLNPAASLNSDSKFGCHRQMVTFSFSVFIDIVIFRRDKHRHQKPFSAAAATNIIRVINTTTTTTTTITIIFKTLHTSSSDGYIIIPPFIIYEHRYQFHPNHPILIVFLSVITAIIGINTLVLFCSRFHAFQCFYFLNSYVMTSVFFFSTSKRNLLVIQQHYDKTVKFACGIITL